jgi:hypothetical protein
MLPGAIVALVIAVVAAVLIHNFVAARMRREALQRLADTKRMRFYRRDPFKVPAIYGYMRLCSKGHAKSASNVIAGETAYGELRYFDYKYTEGRGDKAHTYRKSACGLNPPYYFTRLLVRPENFLDKAAGMLGFEDIDLDNAEFNRKFYVSCDDKKFAYDVLNQRAMEFLLARPGITMEMAPHCILFSYDSRLSPDGVAALIGTAEQFCALLPDFLRNDRQMAAAPHRGPTAPAPGHSGGALSFEGIEPTRRRSANENPK